MRSTGKHFTRQGNLADTSQYPPHPPRTPHGRAKLRSPRWSYTKRLFDRLAKRYLELRFKYLQVKNERDIFHEACRQLGKELTAERMRAMTAEEKTFYDHKFGMPNYDGVTREVLRIHKRLSGIPEGHENVVVTSMFIDVDNFKRINDTYNHDVGDFFLRRIFDVIRERFQSEQRNMGRRSTDSGNEDIHRTKLPTEITIIGRKNTGMADELLVIKITRIRPISASYRHGDSIARAYEDRHITVIEDINAQAHKVREAIADLRFSEFQKIKRVGVTIGISSRRGMKNNPEAFLEDFRNDITQADNTMLDSKALGQDGRDKVVLHTELKVMIERRNTPREITNSETKG